MSSASAQSAPTGQLPHGLGEIIATSGYCRKCGLFHGLPMGRAYHYCRQLMQQFEKKETIDLHHDKESATGNGPDSALSTEYLFGKARGKMFGVLECRDSDGSPVILRAFSGQYNGLWSVPGWAPPLFDLSSFQETNDPVEKEIKLLGARMLAEEHGSDNWYALRRTRRQMSRRLMKELHGLYRLHNFHGQVVGLDSAFTGENGIPTGTGDCCAPKLLNLAAGKKLTPVSIAEFYWGLDNKSNTRHHGRFYPSCREKCQPILGYLLCGSKTVPA